MPFTDICFYFIIAILGMAYPISLQVVTRLDEKYSSVNILDLFEKELWGRWFIRMLYGSLLYVVFHIIWKVNFKANCPENTICYFWPDYILIVVSVLLVALFLLYTKRIFVYYSPYRLVEYLKKQKNDDDFRYFKSLADIFYLAIRIQDDTLSQTIHAYFYDRFRDIRNSAGKQEVVYPVVFYQMVYNALIAAGELDSRKLKNIGLNIASGRYFLGQHEYTHISQATFDWLWNNLRFISEIKNDDFAFEYWHNAHQFFSSAIPYIPEKRDKNDFLTVLNQEEVDQRAKEKEKFYEFQFALGGMLLYAERYKLLNRIFRHTMSIPPRYELLPSTMTTVFSLFIRFVDQDHQMFPYKYHFYGMEGISGEGQSQNGICKYIALTLLRQYTVTSYYYGFDPIALPYLPSSRSEKKSWLNCMEYLKSCIRDIQGEKELMETTGLNIVTDAWCSEKKILSPLKLVDEVIRKLQSALDVQEVEQEISEEKVTQFYEKSGLVIKDRLSSFKPIFIPERTDLHYEVSTINGAVDLIKKEAFAEEQGVTYLDFDTRLASRVASKITSAITEGFYSHVKNSYLFKSEELFQAIEKLKPDPQQHILLNFGIHIPTINQTSKIEGLTDKEFKGIPIIAVPFFDKAAIRSSILIIKKEFLPSLNFNDQQASEIEKFALHQIDSSISLFGTVIDLNGQPQFKTLFRGISGETLDISVMLKLALSMEIKWVLNSSIVELKLYSDFFQEGIPNKLSEIN